MVRRAVARTSAQASEEFHPRIADRAIGMPTLYFGSIPIGVRVYPAAQAAYQEFRWISPEGHPIQIHYHDRETGKPVSRDELRKAIEISKDKFLTLTNEEWKCVNGNKRNMIELKEAIPHKELSPFSIEQHYFLSPAKKSHKAYRLLRWLLHHTKRAMLGKWYLPNGRDKFVMVSTSGQALVLSKLFYQAELRTLPLEFSDASMPSPQEVRLAADLLDRMTPERVSLLAYQDEWGVRLTSLVEKKPNISALLKDSIRKAKRKRTKR